MREAQRSEDASRTPAPRRRPPQAPVARRAPDARVAPVLARSRGTTVQRIFTRPEAAEKFLVAQPTVDDARLRADAETLVRGVSSYRTAAAGPFDAATAPAKARQLGGWLTMIGAAADAYLARHAAYLAKRGKKATPEDANAAFVNALKTLRASLAGERSAIETAAQRAGELARVLGPGRAWGETIAYASGVAGIASEAEGFQPGTGFARGNTEATRDIAAVMNAPLDRFYASVLGAVPVDDTNNRLELDPVKRSDGGAGVEADTAAFVALYSALVDALVSTPVPDAAAAILGETSNVMARRGASANEILESLGGLIVLRGIAAKLGPLSAGKKSTYLYLSKVVQTQATGKAFKEPFLAGNAAVVGALADHKAAYEAWVRRLAAQGRMALTGPPQRPVPQPPGGAVAAPAPAAVPAPAPAAVPAPAPAAVPAAAVAGATSPLGRARPRLGDVMTARGVGWMRPPPAQAAPDATGLLRARSPRLPAPPPPPAAGLARLAPRLAERDLPPYPQIPKDTEEAGDEWF